MALTLVAYNSSAETVHGTTSVTPALPAGYTATNGDRVCVFLVSKRSTTTPDTPATWTRFMTGTGGTGTAGVDAGPLRVGIYYKDVSGGSITIPAFTQTSHTGAVLTAFIAIYRATGYSMEWAGISDTTSGTALGGTFGTPLSSTAPGDQLAVIGGVTSDTPTFNSISVTQSGITYSSFTERLDVGTTNGDDQGACLYTGSVSSGSSATGPAITLTMSGATTGIVLVLRVREVAPPVVTAPADSSITVGNTYTETATATNSPTSWAWTVESGPDEVGNTVSTDDDISWTPDTAGTFVLRATATNAGGSGYDDVTVTVNAAGGGGGGDIAVDASSPAAVEVSSTTATTAAFNPPANSLIVAALIGDPTRTWTISNNGAALTWQTAGHRSDADGSSAGIYYASLGAARTGMTVTATSAVNNNEQLRVFVVTGDWDTADPIGAVVSADSVAVNDLTFTMTPETTGGLAVVAAADYTSGTAEATSSPDLTAYDAYDLTGNIAGGTGYRVMGNAGGTESFTINQTGNSVAGPWVYVAAEIRAVAAAADTNHGRMFPFMT